MGSNPILVVVRFSLRKMGGGVAKRYGGIGRRVGLRTS